MANEMSPHKWPAFDNRKRTLSSGWNISKEKKVFATFAKLQIKALCIIEYFSNVLLYIINTIVNKIVLIKYGLNFNRILKCHAIAGILVYFVHTGSISIFFFRFSVYSVRLKFTLCRRSKGQSKQLIRQGHFEL